MTPTAHMSVKIRTDGNFHLLIKKLCRMVPSPKAIMAQENGRKRISSSSEGISELFSI
jgi:hypothetical protein